MISVEDREKIRWAYFIEQKSVRQIARELHVARKTIRKAIASAEADVYTLQAPRLAPLLGPYKGRIDELLAENEQLPPKQRYTGHLICKELAKIGYQGSEPTVRRYIAQRRREKRRPKVYIPLEFDPATDAQADWGEAVVEIAGERVTVQIFHMRLCYSRKLFMMAFPTQNQEAFFEGHVRAFHYFGGYMRNRQLRDVRGGNRSAVGFGPNEILAAAKDDPRGRREGSVQPIHLSFSGLVALTAARFSAILGLTQEEGERVRSAESISSFS